MAKIEVDDFVAVLRRPRLSRVLSGSLLLAALYVISFVHLKTQLAIYGFQVELTSLAITDLLLAHRYFAAQHFFVWSGILQAYFVIRFGWGELRTRKVASALALLMPLLILAVAYALSAWSEPGVPQAVNLRARGLPLALLSGWVGGALAYALGRRATENPTSVAAITWILAAALSIAFVVFTYRLYAAAAATDRLSRGEFQTIASIETEGSTFDGPCAVVHIDSRGLYLHCGPDKRIVERDKLRSFRVLKARGGNLVQPSPTEPDTSIPRKQQ